MISFKKSAFTLAADVVPGRVLYINKFKALSLSLFFLFFILETISLVRSPLSIGLGDNPIFFLSEISFK